MFIALAIFLFVLLVVAHEYGHFLAAKRNGVEVEEFGIGFPPKIGGKIMGKGIFRSYYSLNWLPIGGFVRMKGEYEADKREGSFGSATFWQKTKIIIAGVTVNFMAAVLIFTILAWLGMPKMVANQFSINSDLTNIRKDVSVAQISEDSPAELAGFRVGDNLKTIAGEQITDSTMLYDLTDKYAGQEVTIEYERNKQFLSTLVKLNDSEDSQFGVGPADIIVDRYTWSAPVVGVGTTVQLAGLTYQGIGGAIGDLFTGKADEAAETISGPVGVVVILKNVAVFGLAYLMFFIAVISLTLAVVNALPFPALDGGRLFVSGIFTALKKPLSKKAEGMIHGMGFVLLMVLILLITIVDVNRFI